MHTRHGGQRERGGRETHADVPHVGQSWPCTYTYVCAILYRTVMTTSVCKWDGTYLSSTQFCVLIHGHGQQSVGSTCVNMRRESSNRNVIQQLNMDVKCK